MSDQPVELTESLRTFVASIMKTDDFVYAKALQHFHGREKHSRTAWRQVLTDLKNKPV